MLTVAIQPSRRLAAWLVALHAAAAMSLWIVSPPFWAGLLGSALLLASGVHTVLLHALNRSERAVQALILDGEGRLEVVMGGGRLPVTLLPASFVTPWLTVLVFDCEGRRRSVLLTADRVEADAFRRLRVRLIWGRPPPAVGEETAQ